jgi:ketosteroid isomerase-like protein
MKKLSLNFRMLVLIAVMVSGCTQKQNQEQDDFAAINELYNQYVHFVETSDLDGFMSLWEENGMRSEPGVPTIIGKENIRAHFKEIFDPFNHKISPLGEPIIEVCDNIAYSYRTVTLTVAPKDGGTAVQQDIKVLSIMRRQTDNSWKAYIDCVNFHPTWSMDSIPSELTEENPYY